jgi:hypothetical protein
MENDVLITFDTTGSMYPCLHEVKQRVEEMVSRLFLRVPGLRIGIITHGDYCDPHPFWTILPFTQNQSAIASFINMAPRTDGGDAPEAYEYVLDQALIMDWRADNRVIVMIGDDVPHEPSYLKNTRHLNWRTTLQALNEKGVKVHGVHCMGSERQHSLWFYRELAEKTGGRQLSLAQFSDIETLILAVGFNQAGTLEEYTRELETSGRLTKSVATILLQLNSDGNLALPEVFPETSVARRATRAISRDRVDGLVPVPPGRFQVLSVPKRVDIRSFVYSTGAEFLPGNGFYEFTKTELVQEEKLVVLMDKETGEMFTGSQAREFIGLPFGERGNVRPSWSGKWTVFIQSTSYTRVLMPGTKFLYQVKK